MLKIATGLSLPIETVTQSAAILAKRRVGKSYLARRISEQLLSARQQVVIIDPKGDQWGIRSSSDGKGPGFSIVVFGGERGDVPLEPGAGALIAKLIVEESISALLDLSLLRKHEVATFMATFLEELYRLKAREIHRTAMMLIVDEADAIAPQKPQPNEARMLGAMQDIVRRGGQRGIGCIMVTQRSAVLNKDVLTQVQMLVTLRTIAPQDLAAIKAWIDVHGTLEQQKTLMASLPSLPVGDAWFWSPGWPTDEGIFVRAHTLPITTYDSGATPKPGQKRAEPKKLAAVDLERIRQQMAETIERAKADDPKALRARIAELEKQLAKKPAAVPAKVERVEVPVPFFDQHSFEQFWRSVREHINAAFEAYGKACVAARLTVKLVDGPAVAKARPQPNDPIRRNRQPDRESVNQPAKVSGSSDAASSSVGNGAHSLDKCARALLAALAQHGRLSLIQAALIAGYAPSSGALRTTAAQLRALAYVTGGNDALDITAAGRTAAGKVDPMPTGRELAEYWYGKLDKCEREILRVVVDSHPDAVSLIDAAQVAGYNPSSGALRTTAAKLRTLTLVHGKNSGMVADERLVD